MDKAARLAAAEKSTATRRAYAADFTIFSSWCRNRGVTPLPAEPATVSAFLAFEVGLGRRPSTLGRRLAAIQFWHLTAGHEPPTTAETVRATLRGIRRVFGTARHRKAPATAGLAKAMARATPATLVGLRDRALILLGFAGALRRSELVGLDVADLLKTEKGLLITIRRSKTEKRKASRLPFPMVAKSVLSKQSKPGYERPRLRRTPYSGLLADPAKYLIAVSVTAPLRSPSSAMPSKLG
jgi:site-specific recombinase XerD